MEQWQLYNYQSAATAMCYKLGLDPHLISPISGQSQWTIYAQHMLEYKAMLETMRDSGHL